MKTNDNERTNYIQLTDLWQEGNYAEVGHIIQKESWSASRIAEFCAYFFKYCGAKELEVLHKFL